MVRWTLESYHLRRAEKAITDEAELYGVIESQCYMTLAMCMESQPYLVNVNYCFDRAGRCFYFHCANTGRKISYLRANPAIWGQVLEDCGYLPGSCDHAFRTVQFDGWAEFIKAPDEKVMALDMLLDHLEPNPEPVRERLMRRESLSDVTIVKVHVRALTGKKNKVQQLTQY
jgi:uncharacterized protein